MIGWWLMGVFKLKKNDFHYVDTLLVLLLCVCMYVCGVRDVVLCMYVCVCACAVLLMLSCVCMCASGVPDDVLCVCAWVYGRA